MGTTNKAKSLNIDDGLLRLDINGNGVLEFNPSDPNVYHRFMGLVNDLPRIQAEYQKHELPEGTNDEIGVATVALEQLSKIDAEMKSRLSAVFGRGTDFDVLLGGASLMGFGSNGERVIANLLNALTPYMQEGLQRHMNAKAGEAVEAAKQRRAQQSR